MNIERFTEYNNALKALEELGQIMKDVETRKYFRGQRKELLDWIAEQEKDNVKKFIQDNLHLFPEYQKIILDKNKKKDNNQTKKIDG